MATRTSPGPTSTGTSFSRQGPRQVHAASAISFEHARRRAEQAADAIESWLGSGRLAVRSLTLEPGQGPVYRVTLTAGDPEDAKALAGEVAE